MRSAILHLLHRPALARELEPPHRFAALRQPGIDLLAELVTLIRERPDISTGILLEHFADREEATPLQKLATQSVPGDDAMLRDVFLDAIGQLEKQLLQQRIDELQQQRDGGLSDADKQELRELLQAQRR